MTTIFYVFLLFVTVSDAKFFKFEDCSQKHAIATDAKFEVSPDPVLFSKNVTVNLGVTLLRDVPPGAVLKTKHFKLLSVFGVPIDVPIPCMFKKSGSCTFEVCDYLKLFKDQLEPFYPKDKEYGCPVTAGFYGAKGVEIHNPDVSASARVIASGKYRTELSLLDKDGKQLACYRVFSELK